MKRAQLEHLCAAAQERCEAASLNLNNGTNLIFLTEVPLGRDESFRVLPHQCQRGLVPVHR